METRVGIGYDIHPLVDGRPLFLGGIEIPYVKGLLGHSDADALLHAVCDALLGAAGLGDIGEHFPDTDPQYEGIDSSRLLEAVAGLLKDNGFSIGNIDSVVIAQQPKLVPFKKQMRDRIAAILKIKEEAVSVKAKTNEGLGAVGNEEAIAAYAVAVVYK
ncbi:MAG TPA: 2-C-methyl-D-erythritol 2,4-cyclodiphosphate synthase [Patescibacteria group bacterium]|nr:2-C-methyl-D-erythritol 2,4-cyclodiphosphate synthase [Patescibacteria group bacterium]